MENKDLISKWLNDELSARELEAFKQSADYRAYKNIVENAGKFERPEFDAQKGLMDLKKKLSTPKETPVRRLDFKSYYKIAAVLVVVLASGIFFLLNRPEIITTGASEMVVFELPDQSKVNLNAGSKIIYEPSEWEKQRTVRLEGEAYFQVEKGQKFTVKTDQGEVAVLGTQFNVKDRKDYFEVYCYEGAVKVTVANREVILNKGKAVKVIDGNLQSIQTFDKAAPGWTFRESDFEAVPLQQVIAELERQFNIRIETRNVDRNQLFSGSFTHDNKEIALKAVTIPLQLKYKIESDKKVLLYEE